MMIDDSQSMKIELFLSCRNLKDTDVFSKSDPYVSVQYKRDFTQKNYSILGITIFMKVEQKQSKTSWIQTTLKHLWLTIFSSLARMLDFSCLMMMVMARMIILDGLKPQLATSWELKAKHQSSIWRMVVEQLENQENWLYVVKKLTIALVRIESCRLLSYENEGRKDIKRWLFFRFLG